MKKHSDIIFICPARTRGRCPCSADHAEKPARSWDKPTKLMRAKYALLVLQRSHYSKVSVKNVDREEFMKLI